MSNKRSSLLWSIEKEGSVSYIFGTMHVKDYRVHSFVNLVKPFLDRCSAFASEFHLNEMAEVGNTDFQYFPDGNTLKDYLPEVKYKKLVGIVNKSFQIDITPFDRLLPLLLINIISESVLYNSENLALDSVLWKYAEQNNKELFGLESIQDQFNILSAIPISYQVKSLLSIGKNPQSFRTKLVRMIDLYEKQDIDMLYRLSKRTLGKQRRLMIYERNAKMALRLADELSSQQSTFCAVGAAHLSGKYGILALLKKRAFVVKPVFFN
jgi:uncharacterized protein YbaP (TraB family)